MNYVSSQPVQVQDGTLNMLHCKPPGVEGTLPVFFVPGWGTFPEGFQGFYRIINLKAEYYLFETREKGSSILQKDSSFSMDSHGRDLAAALETAGFSKGREYILVGSSWGSAVIGWSLAKGYIHAEQVILFDPMIKLWFPRWLLDFFIAWLPVSLLRYIKPVGKKIALFGMKEKVQRSRMSDFIDAADLWKWRKAAIGAKTFSFPDIAETINGTVWIVNGVQDKVHDSSVYPELAHAIPNGHFLRIPVDEAYREELIAAVSLEFARNNDSTQLPDTLKEFEVKFD